MARTVVLLAAFLAMLMLAAPTLASSHSEAPGTAAQPNADITDLYAFMSYEEGKNDTVVFIMNVQPMQAPFGGPNYFTLSDKHYYELYIDNDGDAIEDITFQFRPGARMGGSSKTYITVDPQDHVGDACPPMTLIKENITQNAGIELDINGTMVPVPLKTVGAISASSNANLNWFEYYDMMRIDGTRETGAKSAINQQGTSTNRFNKPFDYSGTKTFGDATAYETYAKQYQYTIDIPNCHGTTRQGRVFVGQRKESFSVNLGGIFDLINFNPVTTIAGAITNSDSNNPLRNFNVNSFILEVPKQCVVKQGGSDTFGVWAGTRDLVHLANGTHIPTRQFSRLGNPLVNEVVIGLRDKAMFNADQPKNDAVNDFVKYVTHPTLPAIINSLFLSTVNTALGTSLTNLAPNTPRNDLVTAFLTGVPGVNKISPTAAACEYMRLNTTIAPTAASAQKNMGVIAGDNAGFPNGRRPGDDVVDIALMVMMGRLCHLSLGVCSPSDAPVGNVDITDGAPQNAAQFDAAFPYLKTPIAGYPYTVTASVSPASASSWAFAAVF